MDCVVVVREGINGDSEKVNLEFRLSLEVMRECVSQTIIEFSSKEGKNMNDDDIRIY